MQRWDPPREGFRVCHGSNLQFPFQDSLKSKGNISKHWFVSLRGKELENWAGICSMAILGCASVGCLRAGLALILLWGARRFPGKNQENFQGKTKKISRKNKKIQGKTKKKFPGKKQENFQEKQNKQKNPEKTKKNFQGKPRKFPGENPCLEGWFVP